MWRIGKGDVVQFWKDRWVSNVPLNQHDGVLNMVQPDCTIFEFMADGWWDIGKLHSVLN